ncbi:hypothetical protein [Microbacterium kyungheense]|uniref:Uncharacterized protein n=1 Tax=Microbacterium kyungheense TaxID=1263636 RepID=A0A543FM48_9MICO|nr:hypothetical protein [Microbacterium kyungheense]TQM34928.1 hypothetical protein FB391_1224 [Microbacterium kyungheense]
MDRTTLSFNIAFMAISAVVLLVLLAAMTGRASSYRRADAMSRRLRLPYGTAATRDVIAARTRRGTTWSLATALVGLCGAAPLLMTPLGTETYFLLIAVVPCILLPTAAAHVFLNLRERLFHPAPHVPRIARLTRMRTRDYLGPAGLRAPWVLAALLVVTVVADVATRSTASESAAQTSVVAFSVVATVAVALQCARPLLDRLVLDRPQPAADTLELAWDDAFRTETLRSLALVTCQVTALALSLGVIILASPGTLWAALATQLPTWAVIAPQFIYLGWNGQRPLRPALYPEWLRTPVPAADPEGSPA